MISSQPHLGDHYICLCMLNILRNYTRQVSKSRPSRAPSLSLSLASSFFRPSGPACVLSSPAQRDRETITITGHSSLAQDYFPGEKSDRRFYMRALFFARAQQGFTDKPGQGSRGKTLVAENERVSECIVVSLTDTRGQFAFTISRVHRKFQF